MPTPNSPSETANLKRIRRVVVVGMENRSFDHMLGYASIGDPARRVNGLRGTEFNMTRFDAERVQVALASTLLKPEKAGSIKPDPKSRDSGSRAPGIWAGRSRSIPPTMLRWRRSPRCRRPGRTNPPTTPPRSRSSPSAWRASFSSCGSRARGRSNVYP